MKKPIGILCLLLVLVMVAGCGANNSATPTSTTVGTDGGQATSGTTQAPEETIDISQAVSLKMYFLGGEPKDLEMVWTEVNKKLKEKINAEVKPAIMGWGEWADKYPLIFASGEEWDMIYTADWAKYSEQSTKGGFWELTPELLAKYAPLTVQNLPQAAFDGTKVNGKNYMIPANSRWAHHYGFIVRGDLREKYGLPEIKTVEDLEAFMDKVLENEKDMIPLADLGMNSHQLLRATVWFQQELWSVVDGVGTLLYNYGDSSKLELTPSYEVNGLLDYLKRMVEWRKKGYLSRSALTYDGNSTDQFGAGKGAVAIDHITAAHNMYQKSQQENLGWKIEFVDLTGGKKLPSGGFLGNGAAIHSASKNPERALMALDLLGYDPEINFMIMQGLPGIHVNNVGTEQVRRIENLTDTYGGSYSQWCFDNFVTRPVKSFDGYEKLADQYFNNQITFHPVQALVFNPESVNAEIAATTTVRDTYNPVIYLGFTDDAEKTLNDYIRDMKAAGIEKVDAAIKAQAEVAFDANK